MLISNILHGTEALCTSFELHGSKSTVKSNLHSLITLHKQITNRSVVVVIMMPLCPDDDASPSQGMAPNFRGGKAVTRPRDHLQKRLNAELDDRNRQRQVKVIKHAWVKDAEGSH